MHGVLERNTCGHLLLTGHKRLAWDFVASTLVPGHLGHSEQEAQAERKSLQLEALCCQQPQNAVQEKPDEALFEWKCTWPESPRSGRTGSVTAEHMSSRKASLFPSSRQQRVTSRYVLSSVPCGCRSARWWRSGACAGAADHGRCESWSSSGCAWRRRRSWSSAAEENPPLPLAPPPRLDRRGHRLEPSSKDYATHLVWKSWYVGLKANVQINGFEYENVKEFKCKKSLATQQRKRSLHWTTLCETLLHNAWHTLSQCTEIIQ